jgi:hypothetical protein
VNKYLNNNTETVVETLDRLKAVVLSHPLDTHQLLRLDFLYPKV